MALNSSGPISLGGSTTGQSTNIELGQSTSTQISLNDTLVRTMAGKTSANSAISFSDLYGKTAEFIFNDTISSDQSRYHLRNAAILAGWNGIIILKATVTINAGVTVGTAIGYYAFDTGASFPVGSILTLNNYGSIIGWGGPGGYGGGITSVNPNQLSASSSGSNGGPALYARSNITISNFGTIGGGGGGGGGGGSAVSLDGGLWTGGLGGGGGGGAGSPIGSGGAAGSWSGTSASPGSSGTANSGGNGGSYLNVGTSSWSGRRGGSGGNGGSLGANGSAGEDGNPVLLQSPVQGLGGAVGPAGAAIVGNSYITWSVTGTRYGAIT
jgi:hypothetical protein